MAGFPNSPVTGDSYTLGDKSWEWNGELWRIKTTGAVGPQGNQGTQGNEGSAGSAGVQGNQGNQGNQGRQGIAGTNGAQGNQGNQGRQGAQGPSGTPDLTYSGTKPSSPDAGDMWFDSDNGVFYVYLNDGNSSQWVEIIGDNGDPPVFLTSTTGLNADMVFVQGQTGYKNSFITLNEENMPLLTKFAEEIHYQGTANSSGGQTFTLNLDDASIHYADMTTGTTSGTYSFTFTGNSELTASNTTVLILRGGENLTFNWVDVSWEDAAGAPDFTSATAGVYSLIPFSHLTINNIGWIGGSVSVYKP